MTAKAGSLYSKEELDIPLQTAASESRETFKVPLHAGSNDLAPHFDAESTESMGHAASIRSAIVKLGGVAVTEASDVEIVHTKDYEVMLGESLMTEREAVETYRRILSRLDADDEMYDVVQQIQFAEERSVEELLRLM